MRTPPTTIEIPTADAREYFRALGITALFIAASPARSPCMLGHTHDLADSLEEVRARWHCSVQFTRAWWLANESKAQAILQAVEAAFPAGGQGHLVEVDADTVAAAIERAAASARVTLTEHAKAIERVQEVLAHVDSMIEGANARGELKWFNKRYRRWRISAPREATGYTVMRARLRAAVVRSVARGECRIGPQLWNELGLPGSPG